MRPPTPQLDEVARQLLVLFRWWLGQSWWHQCIALLVVLVVLYGLVGGVANMFQGTGDRK